jgi:sec-independent protein translocase protein TatA
MNTSLAVLGLGGGELVLVLVVILVLFGAKRIPEFAKGLGKGINEFQEGFARSDRRNRACWRRTAALDAQVTTPATTSPEPAPKA